MTFDPKSLDDLARRLADAVPPGLTALKNDLEQNFKAVLQSGLTFPPNLDEINSGNFAFFAVSFLRKPSLNSSGNLFSSSSPIAVFTAALFLAAMSCGLAIR